MGIENQKVISSLKGNEAPGGLTIDLRTFAPDCYFGGTGVALAPDGQSLYFFVNVDISAPAVIQTDLEGKLIGAHQLDVSAAIQGIEDIDVVVP